MVQSVFLADAVATAELGERLGDRLPPSSVILLRGDLGAGKTTLTQGIGKGLGISEAIASPTFTLVNEYHSGRIPLYHLDLYRLQPEQVDSVYPETYWEGEECEPGLTVIEWSERLPFLPDSYLQIQLDYTPQHQRQASITVVNMNFTEIFR
ncbi:MAG: tRNA (adenosine(37)-N6)-threonylcarbamoyltransferase complex ATPase subunit type 1 TsaE [Limnothrix sp.]